MILKILDFISDNINMLKFLVDADVKYEPFILTLSHSRYPSACSLLLNILDI